VVVLAGQLGHHLVAAGHGVHGHGAVDAAQRVDGALDALERRADGQADERLVPLGAHALDRRGVGPQRDGGLVRHHPPPGGALDQRGDVGDVGSGDHHDGHVGTDRAGGEADLAHRPEPVDEVVLGLMDEHIGVHDASPPTLGRRAAARPYARTAAPVDPCPPGRCLRWFTLAGGRVGG
jgi:hypothetical protein